MSWFKATEQLIIPCQKGDLLHSPGFENHCCKKRQRDWLEKWFSFLRGASFIMSCCWRQKLNSPDGLPWWPGAQSFPCRLALMWCDLQGSNCLWWWWWGWRWWGVISRALQGPRGHVSRTASVWVFLNGLSFFTLLLKDQFKSSSAVLLLTTPDPNHRSWLWVSSVLESHVPKWPRLGACEP